MKLPVIRFFLAAMVLVSSCTSEDVRKSNFVTEGFRYTMIQQSAGPNVIHIFEIDLKNPLLEIDAFKAGHNIRTTSLLSQIVEAPGQENVIGAVNGDFFSKEGYPSGAQVHDGQILKNAADAWYAMGITSKKQYFIEPISFRGTLIINSFTNLAIDGFNKPRQANESVLYNNFFGSQTNTNVYGAEVTIKAKFSGKSVGDTVRGIVLAVDSVSGNNPLTDSTVVLSVHGEDKIKLVRRMFAGQILEIVIRADLREDKIRTAIGGFPFLVNNKKNLIADNPDATSDFYIKRSARTAVGIADSAQKLFIVCVDGNQTNYSSGMTLNELADWMIGLGCDRALNLDGGGSTTMIVRGQLVNRPSDGAERPISNALLIRQIQRP
ncbi:phosphodiester glycosidase family protein [bacterium]|nr:phosphodiester glycosidase family protein [bacterium]